VVISSESCDWLHTHRVEDLLRFGKRKQRSMYITAESWAITCNIRPQRKMCTLPRRDDFAGLPGGSSSLSAAACWLILPVPAAPNGWLRFLCYRSLLTWHTVLTRMLLPCRLGAFRWSHYTAFSCVPTRAQRSSRGFLAAALRLGICGSFAHERREKPVYSSSSRVQPWHANLPARRQYRAQHEPQPPVVRRLEAPGAGGPLLCRRD